jgi:hypothetical protein
MNDFIEMNLNGCPSNRLSFQSLFHRSEKSSLKIVFIRNINKSFLLKIRGGIRQTSYNHFTVGFFNFEKLT